MGARLRVLGIALIALASACDVQKKIGVEGGSAFDAYICPLDPDGGPGGAALCEIFTEPAHPWQEGCCTDAGLLFIVEQYQPASDAGAACLVSQSSCGAGTRCCFRAELQAHTCCAY